MIKNLIFAFVLLYSFSAFAGFDEGKAAYDQKNWEQAIINLRPAAEEGDERAMIVLGNMYSNGYGVMQNYTEAMSLYKRAAEKNNTEAMTVIGAMYTSGLGVPVHLNTALQWFRRAALMGDQTGAFFYATILYRGNKSDTDDIKSDFYNSYKWFKISAKAGEDRKTRQSALILAELLTHKGLSQEDAAKAEQEAVDWKPADPASLGPLPADPVAKAPAEAP